MQKLICINFKGGANDMESTKLIIFKQIGAKIAYYRTLRGLTQAQLAEIINVSPDTLGRVERGKYNNNISISMLLDIAMGLNKIGRASCRERVEISGDGGALKEKKAGRKGGE